MAAVTLKRLSQLLAGSCLLAAVAAPSYAGKPLTEVADLRYGVTLYHYYQKDYFQALTELYRADVAGGIQGHGDNPAIIEGGISLAFGMKNSATEIFTQLLADESRPPKVRNTAWFYLAKLAYTRGQWDDAEAALAKLDREHISRLMAQEAETISASILIRRGQLQEAQAAISQIKAPSVWLNFLNYNMASALGRDGQFEVAIPYYEAVWQAPIKEDSDDLELQLVLRDRARTAAGYSELALGSFPDASIDFSRVRLTPVLANQALLGNGWAALNRQLYSTALAPWQELLRRNFMYPEVQEAHLAIPFAYEKMGAAGEALLAYANAESAYEQELDRIARARQELQRSDLLQLLAVEIDRNSSWLADQQPDLDQVINYLHTLVAQNQFQARVQELRDLQSLQQNIDQWQVKLTDYRDLSAARASNRAAQAETVAALDYPTIVARLVAQRDQLQAKISRIEAEHDYLALADEQQSDLVKRANSAYDKSQRLAEQLSREQIAKARLLRGILYWQEAQSYHDKRWQLQQAMAAANAQLDAVKESYQRVQLAVDQAPDLIPMNERMAAAQVRLDTNQQRLSATMDLVTAELQQQLLAELELQRKRVLFFLSEARLSIARLYDHSNRNANSVPVASDSAAIDSDSAPIDNDSTPIDSDSAATDNNNAVDADDSGAAEPATTGEEFQ
ncbi:hypothetical protein [Halioxenophilus sp. WMMB6]|uniref:hypothetical protein n=1 Tax=Halioxenophilus sp. WMMB6 TaxID=3073815 RepID=UPI00295F1B82|nr:hypothetical protein [Halioxenophilus sp. WMMB6]